jgi:hypothetical protein
MPHHDDYPDDSELGAARPEIHNHYHQSKSNGNGASVNKALWAISGVLLLGLLAIQAFMWRDQISFQRDVIDRLARVETRLAQQP